MEPLWNELERLGVRPGGIDEAAAEPPPPASGQDVDRTEVDEIVPVDASSTDENSEPDSSDTDLAPAIVETNNRVDGVSQPAASSAGGSADGLLSDYVSYSGSPGPDPRTVNIGIVAEGLCQIIDTEGPMIAKRAYDIYLRGCGIKRLGGELKSTMNKALANAIRQGRVISENEPDKSGLIWSTVRSNGTPKVKPRRRGPRTLDEIPPGELRAVGRHLCEARQMARGSDEHLRTILEYFDLKRLTTQVGTTLLEVLDRNEG
jgi:hypothetical protein